MALTAQEEADVKALLTKLNDENAKSISEMDDGLAVQDDDDFLIARGLTNKKIKGSVFSSNQVELGTPDSEEGANGWYCIFSGQVAGFRVGSLLFAISSKDSYITGGVTNSNSHYFHGVHEVQSTAQTALPPASYSSTAISYTDEKLLKFINIDGTTQIWTYLRNISGGYGETKAKLVISILNSSIALKDSFNQLDDTSTDYYSVTEPVGLEEFNTDSDEYEVGTVSNYTQVFSFPTISADSSSTYIAKTFVQFRKPKTEVPSSSQIVIDSHVASGELANSNGTAVAMNQNDIEGITKYGFTLISYKAFASGDVPANSTSTIRYARVYCEYTVDLSL